MYEAILKNLDADDDITFWKVALDSILSDFIAMGGETVEIGRCSHWLRPHQLPFGYGGGSYYGKPLFDWSVVLRWDGQDWTLCTKTRKSSLRVTIPSRTV